MSPRRSEPRVPDPQVLAPAFAGLQRWLDDGLVPAVAAVIARDGYLIGEFYGGEVRPGEPLGPTSLFSLGSLTSLYTTCAAMTLVQDGLLALDEPLDRLLTELAEEDRASLSLHRLLTHSSGLPPDLGSREWDLLGPTPSLEEIYQQLALLRPIVPPGSQVRYSGLNLLLVARVVERASGKAFGSVLKERVLEPLGLSQTFLPPPSDTWERLVPVVDTRAAGAANEPFNSAWWRELGLPASGAVAPAREVARFLSGVLAEPPAPGFLGPAVLDCITRCHTADLAGGVAGAQFWNRAEWGLGVELRGDKRVHAFGELTSPETFGHVGLEGSTGWVDPESGVVCAVLTNRPLAHAPAARLVALSRFANAVVAALVN